MIKAVLFDLDDTLFDHGYAAKCVLQDLQERHAGLQGHPLEFLEQEDRRLLEEKHVLVLARSLSVNESRVQRLQALFKCCGEEITRDYALELAERRQMVYRQSRRATPGAVALLQALRYHTKIGIVTNNFTEEQRDKIRVCDLEPFVDVLVTSEEVGCAKPAPQIFQAALDRLDCEATETVMVGDSWEIDIVGAQNAGIRGLWFNPNGAITSLEPADIVAARIISPATFAQDLQSHP